MPSINNGGARPAALFVMDPVHLDRLFPPAVRKRLSEVLRLPESAAPHPAAAPDIDPAEVEVLITGWGCTPLTEPVLAGLPRLRAVLHAAGSVKHHITPACWERDLVVSSAAAANALPVAEFTLGAILLSGKNALGTAARYADGGRPPTVAQTSAFGNYRRRIGIVGASRIGRRVIELLRPFDFEVAVHDPYLPKEQARELGVRPLPLDELCAVSDVLSLHAPAVPATRGLLDARRLALLPDGATVINTARGSLVDHAALEAELVSGRITAVLDVTEPEPLPADSPLFGLDGVLVTPHIAGALGNELERLGDLVADEAAALCASRPLEHRVHRSDLDTIA
ncbi:hydroxyacid dehydrogenase [Streptomyces harbinensis]|uniref:hydroxyacid dehydrogenase n=1 Tax=Streptomyces harbinensis TaxID=1176198 RepID=UPI0036B5CB8A